MTRYSKSERDESLARLREILPPGSTVYTIIRSVSRSGMSRTISLMAKDKDGDLMGISGHIARVLGWRLVRGGHDAIHVDGCGMDMCFHTVNSLSYALHGMTDKSAPSPKGSDITRPDNYRAGYSLTYRDL